MEMMAESRTKKEKNSMNSPLIILDSPNNSPWKKLLNVFRDQGCCRPKKEKRTLDDDENSIESDSLCVSSSDFSSSDSSSSVPGDIVVNLDADRLVMECTSDLIESQSSQTEDSTSSSVVSSESSNSNHESNAIHNSYSNIRPNYVVDDLENIQQCSPYKIEQSESDLPSAHLTFMMTNPVSPTVCLQNRRSPNLHWEEENEDKENSDSSDSSDDELMTSRERHKMHMTEIFGSIIRHPMAIIEEEDEEEDEE